MGIKTLFWVLVALNFLDFGLTAQILASGGQEFNPWVDLFIQRFGTIGILYAKLPNFILLGVAIYFFWDRMREKTQRLVNIALSWVAVGYFIVNTYSASMLLILYS